MQEQARTERPYIVGVAGGSGSGKTSFVAALRRRLGDRVTFLSQDNYYRPLGEQERDARGEVNFDRPESIDEAAMLCDLKTLLAGRPFRRKRYMHNESDQRGEEMVFEPRPVLVVEGIFALHYPKLAELIDLKIFIDASDVAKLSRRIQRDQVERNQTLAEVLYRYEHHVLPSYERYVKPGRREADLVVNNNSDFDEGLAVVEAWLRVKLNASSRSRAAPPRAG